MLFICYDSFVMYVIFLCELTGHPFCITDAKKMPARCAGCWRLARLARWASRKASPNPYKYFLDALIIQRLDLMGFRQSGNI